MRLHLPCGVLNFKFLVFNSIDVNKYLTYENIWARNLLFGSFMFVIVFIQDTFIPHFPGITKPTDFEAAWQFVLMYLTLFSYNHFWVRRLLFNGKYALFGLITVIYTVLIALVTLYVEKRMGLNIPFMGQLLSAFTTLFIGTAVYFVHLWVLNNIIKTQIQLLNKEAEITFLKQQLSPHFLFNAINNLYGTALIEPEIITDKLLELSDLLRYQVESTTKNAVLIREEMDFVANYINYTFYKTNDLIVTNKTEGNVKNYAIPPLLFLPLIENAVKYSAETEHPFIHILWHFEEKSVVFYIENSYLTEGSKIKGTKIGMENLKKRLTLLNIKHTLTVNQSALNIFKIELKLWELSINA